MSAATVSLSNTDLLTTKDSYRASVWIYTISKRLRSKSRQETGNDENKKPETTKTGNQATGARNRVSYNLDLTVENLFKLKCFLNMTR